MNSIPIKTARPTEREAVVQVIAESFRADPAARWIYPAARQYDEWFPGFVAAFAGKAFEHRSACCAADHSGAALWLPPEVHPDEVALAALIKASIGLARQPGVFALFAEMDRHHPAQPHWYLPMIGVQPGKQRSGLGSALLRHALKRCDAENHLAYLEASSRQSIPLYERHGFAVTGTIQVGSSPPLFAMVREPRPQEIRLANEAACLPGQSRGILQ